MKPTHGIPTGAQSIRGLHLDLKGVQYRQEYLPQLLADLAERGVNTLLVEYEDMFPFEGFSLALDNERKWTRANLQTFLELAHQQQLQVIPLQQCLGHLEYLFRWHCYRHLALNQKYPSTLDVFNPQAKAFLFEALRQMLEAHPESSLIHLGMDEAHALSALAKERGADVMEIFLNYLDELCALCEEYGKTPVIWSDMLADHLSPASLPTLQPFRERVVLCPWDYNSGSELSCTIRLGGTRISREWLKEPGHSQAPPITGSTVFFEDLPESTQELAAAYRHGRFFTAQAEAYLWKDLGFQLLGASAVRVSADMPVLPAYNKRRNNIRLWNRTIEQTGILGQVATSWARGTTFCRTNFIPDLTWPLLDELHSPSEARAPFFEGIPTETVTRIIQTLGKCHEGWSLEANVATEMAELEKDLKTHQFEWKSIRLMAQVAALRKRAEFALLEVNDFHVEHHPVEPEWQRRLDDHARLLEEIATMRREILDHFSKRYTGEAFEEWVGVLFDWLSEELGEKREICQDKMQAAGKRYGEDLREVAPADTRQTATLTSN